MSRDNSYFLEIEQLSTRRGGYKFPLPIFHYDSTLVGVTAPANYAATRALLPSPRLEPYNLPLGRTILILAAIEHRDSDLGAFNEFLVIVPLRPPAHRGLKTWLLPWRRYSLSFYILHRATNERRVAAGFREIYNINVTEAEVNFEQRAGRIRCHVSGDDDLIIVMEVPGKQSRFNANVRADLFSVRSDRVLRSEIIGKFFGIRPSYGGKTYIEIGKRHFVARDLADLNPGRPPAGWHIPHARFTLTNPIESLPIRQF